MNKLTKLTLYTNTICFNTLRKHCIKLFTVKGSVADEMKKNKPIGEPRSSNIPNQSPVNPDPTNKEYSNNTSSNNTNTVDKSNKSQFQGSQNDVLEKNANKERGGYGDSTVSSNTNDQKNNTNNFYGKNNNKKNYSVLNENYKQSTAYNDYSKNNLMSNKHSCFDDTERQTLKNLLNKARKSNINETHENDLKDILKKYKVKESDTLIKDITEWRDNYL